MEAADLAWELQITLATLNSELAGPTAASTRRKKMNRTPNLKHIIAAAAVIAGLASSSTASAYQWAATYPAAGTCMPLYWPGVTYYADDGLYTGNNTGLAVTCGVPRTTDLDIGDIYKVQMWVTDNNPSAQVSARLVYRKMSTGSYYMGSTNYSSNGVTSINAYPTSLADWSTASTSWAAYVKVGLVRDSGVIGYKLYRK
jgi:hypothetical protein